MTFRQSTDTSTVTQMGSAGHRPRAVVGLIVAALVSACAGPVLQQDRTAARAGLVKRQVAGQGFDHVVYERSERDRDRTLHVYLSGDGTPWITRTRVASDPTPRNPLALRLFALDPSPAIFVGRPCYQGLSNSSPCDKSLWTTGRYSDRVVGSMARALERVLTEYGSDEVVLIGYSGGGVLAWLIAERLPQVTMLVTIAANLDIDAWTNLHGYTPLADSLNPADRKPLPKQVSQLHLAGARDRNVPPGLVRDALRALGSNSGVRIMPSNHHCCWERLWPHILDLIEQESSMRRAFADAPSVGAHRGR